MEEVLLERGEHFYIIAARFALFPGHILINSYAHALTIGDLPPEWMAELDAMRLLARRFLVENYGAASFWENGVPRKHVLHMHLHGWPMPMELPPTDILAEATSAQGVADIQPWYARNGYYHYLQGDLGAYIFQPSHPLFSFISHWLSRQSGNPLSPTGGLVRSGSDATTAAVVERWRAWRATGSTS